MIEQTHTTFKPTSNAHSDRLLNIHQVLERTSMGRSFIYNEIAEGRIKPVKVGRHNRYVESEIDQWIADRVAEREEAKSTQ